MKKGYELAKKFDLEELKAFVWKNLPRGVVTISQCSCGRSSRRGSYPCLECLVEGMGVYIGRNLAWLYVTQIKGLRMIEAEMERNYE